MKITLYLTLLSLCLNGCLIATKKKDFNIPDSVAVQHTDKHIQIANSRIFIVPPKGTAPDKTNALITLAKNADIHLMELPRENYQEAVETYLSEYFRQVERNPNQTLIQLHQKYKQGKDSAAIIFGLDRKNNVGSLRMVIGDTSHAIIINCKMPVDQPDLQQEIITALQTIYIDPAITVDYSAIAPYTADFSGSPFTFSSEEKGVVTYTNISKDSSTRNSIIIMPFPTSLSRKELEDGLNSFKKSRAARQALYEETPNKHIIINGNRAAECSFIGKYDDGDKRAYALFISNEKHSVAFSCYIDPSDPALFETAKSLAKNIRLK